MNIWIKVSIAEGFGLPVIFMHIPIYFAIPMIFISAYAGCSVFKDSNAKLKENIKKFEDEKL